MTSANNHTNTGDESSHWSPHNISLSSTDSFQTVSTISSRSADAPPKPHRNRPRRQAQTYRGVESRVYNSNVRIGKLHTYRHIDDTSLKLNKRSEKQAFQKVLSNDESSSTADTNTLAGLAATADWKKVVSTSRTDYDSADRNASQFKALDECATCGKDKVRLKMLPCLHSFCTECLDKQIDQATSGSWIKCPLCKRRTGTTHRGVEDFDDNVYFQFSEHSISENERCHACTVEIPKCRCSECKLIFCTDCVKDHLNREKDKPHYIVNVAPEMVGKASLDSKCHEHDSFALTLFCVNCAKLICGRCAIGRHNNHVVEDVQVTAKDMRDDLTGLITTGMAKRLTRDITDYMHSSRKERAKLEADVDHTVTSVQMHVRKLKEELEEFEKDAIQTIKRKETSLMETLDSKAKDSELQLRSTHLTLETMRRIIDRARDIELIEKFKNLKSLASDLRGTVKPPPLQSIRLSYTPLIHTLQFSIGRVNVESSLQRPIELVEVCSFQLFKHITSIYPVDATRAWVGFRKYVQLCSKDGSYGVRIDFGEPVMCIAGNSSNTVFVACKTSMKVIGSRLSPKFLFQLPHEPSDMKFNEMDQMIVIFKDARRVAMFSAKGKPLKELDLRHLGFRLGMRVNEPWRIAISETNGIFISDFISEIIAVFDKECEIKAAFSTNVFRHGCIAFGKGLLFLTDYKRDCVHIYSDDGHFLQTCGITGINSPCSIAIDDVSDVWIGSWGGMLKVFTQR